VWRLLLASASLAVALSAAACAAGGSSIPFVGGSPAREVPGGDAQRGARAIDAYGCGACHVIPGVPGARGAVGPSLAGFASRQYIAGELANVPENATRWIQRPQSMQPGVAMPDLGVTDADARDIAAYLYTLR
jgi:cytochrome c1